MVLKHARFELCPHVGKVLTQNVLWDIFRFHLPVWMMPTGDWSELKNHDKLLNLKDNMFNFAVSTVFPDGYTYNSHLPAQWWSGGGPISVTLYRTVTWMIEQKTKSLPSIIVRSIVLTPRWFFTHMLFHTIYGKAIPEIGPLPYILITYGLTLPLLLWISTVVP